MQKYWGWHLALVMLVLTAVGGFHPLASTGAEPSETEERDAKFAAELAKRTLPTMSLTAAGVPLNRPTGSLFRWSNPTADRVYGNVFLWTDGVRPVAVTNLYKFFEPHTTYTAELIAFDDRPLVLQLGTQTLWKPRPPEPGWTAVPNAAAPAVSPAARLGQMRGIAQQVRYELTDKRNDTQGIKQELRLVDRPLYRYPAIPASKTPAANRPLDGALFTYVVSNDPEAWLLVETTESGYRIRCFRMNTDALRAHGHFTPGTTLLAEWPHVTWEQSNGNDAYAARALEEPPAP
jgi:hypothetical protein